MSLNSNQILANQVIEKLLGMGFENFAMAPGSRSTPLIFELEKRKLNLELFYDERSLGFYALGYAKATHKPMPIIVTSGTALANLMPAVCEAHVSKIPMIILSADRPEEEHKCGANQTMDQTNFFGKFCDVFVDLALPQEFFIDLNFVTHINCRFGKPLEPEGAAC